MTKEIRNSLFGMVDEKYRDFNHSLVPGSGAPMLGVRMPKLRELAKKIAGRNGREYIKEISEQEAVDEVYHEELLLHGMVIGYLKCSSEERKQLLDEFVPRIDSWAVCDSSCITYKFIKEDRKDWFSYLQKYVESQKEYEIRFAVVCFLDYFLTDEYLDEVLHILGNIKHDGYYVKMAVAWAVSICYTKFPKKTWELLSGDCLDHFTHQKSLQKIRDSFKVSQEDKERLRLLRRPNRKDESRSNLLQG